MVLNNNMLLEIVSIIGAIAALWMVNTLVEDETRRPHRPTFEGVERNSSLNSPHVRFNFSSSQV